MLDWIGERVAPRKGRAQSADAAGLVGTTRIATPTGWCRADDLGAGDRVVTFDSGVQTVRSVARRLVPGPRSGAEALLRLPAGLIGNAAPLLVGPGQGVMIESDLAEAAWGDPFALVPAASLAGLPGVAEVLPEAPLVVVSLGFEADEMVFAEGQALVQCAGAWSQPATLDDAATASPPRYAMLGAGEARMLAASLAPSPDPRIG
ncbi:hypothetical protein DLJ49_10850 [Rhodovulum sp. 12E13]|uniref:Hint domain-containing protein n=1 Tax=Rhodovulum sp. 12E13 TaxID=2203891 RepID=UPI000E15A2A1|nr:Hint domain-containing protein [Rhodovulum sp. 12E13]RDC72401.1 hypothetical protein DLJ49_10850 [Rhodovulum sp. 12E13]